MIPQMPGERYEMLHQTMTPQALSNPRYIVAKENMMPQPVIKKYKSSPSMSKKNKI